MGEQNNSSDLNGQTSANYDYTLEMCIPSLGVDNGISGNPVSTSEINRNSASSVQRAIEIDDPLEIAITSIKIPHSNAEEIKEARATADSRVGLNTSSFEPNPQQTPKISETNPHSADRTNFEKPPTEDNSIDTLNSNKSEYYKGLMFQQSLNSGSMAISMFQNSVTPQAAGRAFSENLIDSLTKYLGSEKGSDSELEGFQNLNSYNPAYNTIQGGVGVKEMMGRDSFSFGAGQEDANSITQFVSGVMGLYAIISGVKLLNTRGLSISVKGNPRTGINLTRWTTKAEIGGTRFLLSESPQSIPKTPNTVGLNSGISRWTTQKIKGLYGPYYHSASGEVLQAIIDSRELHGTIPRTYYGPLKYARVNALNGNIPDNVCGIQFKTDIKPDGIVRHGHIGDGPIWDERNLEVESFSKFSKFYGKEMDYASIPILIEKINFGR